MSVFNIIPVTSDDYRRRALWRLPRFLFDYLEGGANREQSMAANMADYEKLHIRQSVLRDVTHVDTRVHLLGEEVAFPLVLAPVGMAGLYRRRGETQGARAALKIGVPYTLSTVGICPVEEVKAATAAPFWFQLYMLRDREIVLNMLERAWNAGCTTLVFTVDLPLPGLRLRDFRNGMVVESLAAKLSRAAQIISRPLWVYDVGVRGKPHSFGSLADRVENPENLSSYKAMVESQYDPACTWDDIRWLREQWKGKLVIKGVMEADDARASVDAGADGLVVSNHGGRQLDAVASTISKLPAVADAVGTQVDVLVDGGIRNGIDVIKALACGAHGVMIGRPWVYALSAGGQAAVEDLLILFQKEMSAAMGLMGINNIKDLNRDVIDEFRSA
ncbi:MAG: L-lactate dehydrogenase [Parahaliea sp.]